MHRDRKAEAGFTLLELLVVTVVIGVLAAISIISMIGALDRAKQRSTMADMRTISRAIEAYNVDTSLLPDDSGGLAALVPQMVPYSTSVLPIIDHWGKAYSYSRDNSGNYTLESFGKDGINGDDITLSTKLDFTLDLVIYNGVFVAGPE